MNVKILNSWSGEGFFLDYPVEVSVQDIGYDTRVQIVDIETQEFSFYHYSTVNLIGDILYINIKSDDYDRAVDELM